MVAAPETYDESMRAASPPAFPLFSTPAETPAGRAQFEHGGDLHDGGTESSARVARGGGGQAEGSVSGSVAEGEPEGGSACGAFETVPPFSVVLVGVALLLLLVLRLLVYQVGAQEIARETGDASG